MLRKYQPKQLFLFFTLTLLSCSPTSKQTLRAKLNSIIAGKKATIGIGIMDLKTSDTLILNGAHHYPMQSVFKLHLAMAVLDQVDKQKFTIDQPISIAKSELLPDTHSPLRDDFPKGDSSFALGLILKYTVSQSDNNGCDILFRRVGGPGEVNNYIHGIGVNDIEIVADEEAMHKDWQVQYTNWTTPYSALTVLKNIHDQTSLSKSSNTLLLKLLTETSTGPKKLKGLLPDGTIVAHKTGWSGKNEAGITGASNDIGIISLPGNRAFAIAVFVSDSHETEDVNEKIIAEVAKAAWDHFNSKGY